MKIFLYECIDPTFIVNKYLHCWCQMFVAFKRRKVERSYFRSYHESVLNIYRPKKKKGFINLWILWNSAENAVLLFFAKSWVFSQMMAMADKGHLASSWEYIKFAYVSTILDHTQSSQTSFKSQFRWMTIILTSKSNLTTDSIFCIWYTY